MQTLVWFSPPQCLMGTLLTVLPIQVVRTISGDRVSLLHSGVVTITAIQAATDTSTTVRPSPLPLTIDKASQSINVELIPVNQPLKDFYLGYTSCGNQ